MILSGVVRHWPDFGIILVLLVANAVVGFWEERQASNAIAALKAKLAINARVKRDGKWITPAARELVPGDVIRLRLGDIVPADARLLEGDPVQVDESALTGESLPATRKPGQAVFSGSIMRRGEIGALVYATGEKTYFGKTAQLVQEAHTVSHFQKAVLKIGNYLIILAVALVAADHCLRAAPRRSDPDHVAVRPGADRGRHPRGDADGIVGDDGGWGASARQEAGHCQPLGGDRGTGRRRRAVRRQDRHADAEQADAGRSIRGQSGLGRADRARCGAGLARRRQGHHRSGGSRWREGPERPAELSAGRISSPSIRCTSAPRPRIKGRGRQRIQGEQGRTAGDSGDGGQRRVRSNRPSRKRSTTLRRAAFVHWAWHGPVRMASGSSSGYCRCSIRPATMPKPPSPPR